MERSFHRVKCRVFCDVTQLCAGVSLPQEFQAVQSSTEDKVSTIHQSVDSDEVKKALAKNPDISKERTNLLTGNWRLLYVRALGIFSGYDSILKCQ